MVKIRQVRLFGEKGYSLIELLVVVAAISVIASMSVPALSTVRNSYRLRAGCDEIVGVFETARSAAIKLDSTTTITLESPNQYRIRYIANGVTNSIVYYLPSGVSFNFPSGVTSVVIECRITGKTTITGSNGSTLTGVTLTNTSGNRTFSISIAGNVTITSA